jgi:hypothetical protein
MIPHLATGMQSAADNHLCSGWKEFEETRNGPDGIEDTYYGMAIAFMYSAYWEDRSRQWPNELVLRFACFAEGYKSRTQLGTVRHSCRSRGGLYYVDISVVFPLGEPVVVRYSNTQLRVYWYFEQSNVDGHLNDTRMRSYLSYCHDNALRKIIDYCVDILGRVFPWPSTTPGGYQNDLAASYVQNYLDSALRDLQNAAGPNWDNYVFEYNFDEDSPGHGLPRITGRVGVRDPRIVLFPYASGLGRDYVQLYSRGMLFAGIDVYGNELAYASAMRIQFELVLTLRVDLTGGLSYKFTLFIEECAPKVVKELSGEITVLMNESLRHTRHTNADHPYHNYAPFIWNTCRNEPFYHQLRYWLTHRGRFAEFHRPHQVLPVAALDNDNQSSYLSSMPVGPGVIHQKDATQFFAHCQTTFFEHRPSDSGADPTCPTQSDQESGDEPTEP